MDIANNDRVGKGLTQLKLGLLPYVSNRFIASYQAQGKAGQIVSDLNRIVGANLDPGRPFDGMDVAALLKVMSRSWNDVFWSALGPVERSLVGELRAARNNWAHQEPFSDGDAHRALDSICRLLTAINSPQVQNAESLRAEQLAILTDQQTNQLGKPESPPIPAGGRQTNRPGKAEPPPILSDPETDPEDIALFWINFDSARTTLHRDGCSTIRGFNTQRKIDPRYGWKYFNRRDAASAALGERKFHACRVCNP